MKRFRELMLAMLGVVFCMAVHSTAASAAEPAAVGKEISMKIAHKLPKENQQVVRFSTKDGGEGRRVVETCWQADRFNSLFKILGKQARGARSVWKREGRTIVARPTWLRDHIHYMKGNQYWAKDITSFVDEIITLQHPEGFYYEILGNAHYGHQWYVDKKHFLREDDKDLCWIRLEMGADIEYLMVEAAHRIWQATGDFEAMKRRLPSLERGLEYDFTHPTRWNAEHDLEDVIADCGCHNSQQDVTHKAATQEYPL